MKQSLEINELASALVKATVAFQPAIKATKGNFGKYVTLADAIEAAQKPLLDNGIAVVQGTEGNVEAKSITVTTRVLHTSGQWIEDSLTLPAVNRNEFTAQSAGSAITYARRYSYMAILGFAPEDDDGTSASAPAAPPQHAPEQRSVASPQTNRPSAAGVISEPQSKRFFAICKGAGKSTDDIRRYLLNVCKCERSLDMPRDKYEAACKWAENTSPTHPEPEDPALITDDDIPF